MDWSELNGDSSEGLGPAADGQAEGAARSAVDGKSCFCAGGSDGVFLS